MLLSSVQHVCRAATGQTAGSAAAVLGEPPAITSLESAVVLQDRWETAASRVSAAATLTSGFKRRPVLRKAIFFLCQLVFQVLLGITVTRCASALRLTNSATLRRGSVTAPLAFTGPDATGVCHTFHLYISNITSSLKLTKLSVCF